MPAAIFTFFGAAVQAIVSSLAPSAAAASGSAAALQECVRYGVQQAGNPLSVLFQTAAALISMSMVWPWHGSGGAGHEPALWEHLQRFCWTEGQMGATAAARDVDSTRQDMQQVRSRTPAVALSTRQPTLFVMSDA